MSNQLTATEKIFMIGTSIVAGLAVVVSLWQGYETRRHNRLSVKPIVSFDRNFSDEIKTINNAKKKVIEQDTLRVFSIRLKNQGFGPAIIKRFVVSVDGKPVKGSREFLWREALNTAGYTGKILQASWYENGDVFRSGHNKSLVRIYQNTEVLRRITIEIEYESIYEEQSTLKFRMYD